MSQWYVGIDIAKEKFDVALVKQNKQRIKHAIFTQDRDGFHGLLQMLHQYCEDPQQVYVGMESSGNYHYLLFAFLKEQYTPYVAILNASVVSRYCKTELRPSKTDKKDAYQIACYLIDKEVHFTNIDQVLQQLSCLDKQRIELVEEKSRILVAIRTYLATAFPELERTISSFSAYLFCFLYRFPDAPAVTALSRKKFIKEFTKLLPPRTKNIKFDAQTLYDMASRSIGREMPGHRFTMQIKIDQIIYLEKQIKAIDQQQKRLCIQHREKEWKILLSIPGIGSISAASILSHLPAPELFANYRKIIAYTGTDPLVKESGKWKGHSKITKKGNSNLRRILYWSATKVKMHEGVFQALYERLRARGKPRKVALIAVVNKLIKIMYVLFEKNELFDPQHYFNLLEKKKARKTKEDNSRQTERAHQVGTKSNKGLASSPVSSSSDHCQS